MKIIDAHSHYMPPAVAQNTAFFKAGWSDIGRQLAVMDEHGIEKSLLLYPTSDAHLNMDGWMNVCRVYNEAIASVVKQHRGRFIGAGILPADEPKKFPEELRRIRDLGLKVITIASSYEGSYLDDEMFSCVWEFAKENRMPVHVHPQIINPIGEDRVRDPLLTPVLEYVFDVSICIGKMMMSGTFLRFPDVRFIFAHYGGVLPLVKERFDNTYMMLRKRDFVKDLSELPSAYFQNLYFDTSGCGSAASLSCMLEMVKPAHVLFGSDFPANQNLPRSISVFKDNFLAEEERNAMLRSSLIGAL
jgi:predicted TIM-barrel fold metal-dependent hydrolase